MSQDIYSDLMSATPRFDPLQRPAGGSWYVYKWSEANRKDDWRADGYRWRQCGSMKGTRRLQAGENQLSRMYFHVRYHYENYSTVNKIFYMKYYCNNVNI